MKNYWIANEETAFASWEANFFDWKPEQLLNVAKELLKAGEQQRVYYVAQDAVPSDESAVSRSYLQHLEDTLAATGNLPFFNFGSPLVPSTLEEQFHIFSDICFYNLRGEIIEDKIENMGLLLRQLRPKDVEIGLGFMAPVVPLSIVGQTVPVIPTSKGERITRVIIALYTDIWFPWVSGLLEDPWLPPNSHGAYNNQALAICHTPRFNNFLSIIRTLVTDLGGQWALLGSASKYADLVTINGIRLNS